MSNETIASLSPNDILLGRGRGPSQYVGNKKFLALVETRRKEYNDKNASNKEKAAIAWQVFYEITERRGGRFLSLVNQRQRMRNLVEEGVWCIASQDASLEKVKQALRQRRKKDGESSSSDGGAAVRPRKSPVDDMAVLQESSKWSVLARDTLKASIPSAHSSPAQQYSEPSRMNGQISSHSLHDTRNLLPPVSQTTYTNLVANMVPLALLGIGGTAVENLLLLHQMNMLQSQQLPFMQQQQSMMMNVLRNQYSQVQNSRAAATNAENGRMHLGVSTAPPQVFERQYVPSKLQPASLNQPRSLPVQMHPPKSNNAFTMEEDGCSKLPAAQRTDDPITPATMDTSSGAREEDAMNIAEAEMDALNGLSTLRIACLPKFTKQQEEKERAALTNEEQVAALSDIFGKYCSVDSPKSKRAKRDLDLEAIQFLTKQMRHEIEQIPPHQREALMEAQARCKSYEYEFSDKRLLQFLRCEGMNAKLGAQRLAKYWQARKETFGPDKYLMRMTLSEALQDDLVAIEDAVLCCLPHRDASGRQMVFQEPHHRTRGLYSSDSMLRSFWYIMEVLSQSNEDVNSGYIFIVWDKDISIRDYDPAYDRLLNFEMSCWPVQCIGAHQCCPTGILMKILRPVLIAMSDTRLRTRTRWHCVPETDIFDVLSEYGIRKDMLPTRMGGTVELNQSEWMENRRAIEMQEI